MQICNICRASSDIKIETIILRAKRNFSFFWSNYIKEDFLCISLRIKKVCKIKTTKFFIYFIRHEDLHRIRVEHMERQLANLTGLVQKALVQNPQASPTVPQQYLGIGAQYRNG